MTATCHRYGIESFAYLRDVLDRLAGGTLQNDDLAALLPDRWTPPQAPATPAQQSQYGSTSSAPTPRGPTHHEP